MDYRIFYRIDNKAKVIFIVRIWHGRQNPENLDI
ncbi:Plasmid stabilization system protein [Opitutaceae bacterium TAV1]|nr:Plasmid stabilization system protein [Opitutaceae bacterium TAV1]